MSHKYSWHSFISTNPEVAPFLRYGELQAVNVVFTYPTLIRPEIWQSCPSNYRTMLGPPSREGEGFALLVGDILNICDRNPPTLQTDTQTDGQTT